MTATANSRFIVVVDSLKEISSDFADLPLVSADQYLSDQYSTPKSLKILNLCSHKRPLSTGYYVSLLAEARGQRALPEAQTLHHLERNTLARDAMDELNNLLESSFRRIATDRFTLSVYFGENLAKVHHSLSRKLYALFPSPLVRYEFKRSHSWRLVSVHHLGLNQVPAGHLDFVRQRLGSILAKPWRSSRASAKAAAYDLAILANPDEPTPPSNEAALKKFIRAAEHLGMHAEIINPRDFPRLLEFDALFLRETTRLDNHTFRFALKAQRAGMPVIDDPESIRRCCNKVFLNELMKSRKIPTPQATLLTRRNYESASEQFQYPIILKIPDGSFSIGVYKAKSRDELIELCRKLLTTSSILLAQEYLPTDYDWRIGIVSGRPLYACRYFMSKGHWQIYNHAARGSDVTGDSDGVPIEKVPSVVIETALAASNLIGNSFYGVDIKHVGDRALIIEVNDNPSVDAGVEDELIGDQLYRSVMEALFLQLEKQRETSLSSRPPSKPVSVN